MQLAEPPRTNYDVHFSLFGVPVRIHPLFWLATLILGISGPKPEFVPILIWMLAVFVSLLVHEFGHAVAIRRFGWRPRIILYSFGGLAAYETQDVYSFSYHENDEHPRAKILIAAAGPAAGFLFAAVIVLLMLGLRLPNPLALGPPLGIDFQVRGLTNPKARMLIEDLLYVNIFWGLMNLLPVFPLDGGQISRELFTQRRPHDGVMQSLRLSIFTGGSVAAFSLIWFSVQGDFRTGLFLAVLFGYLAYMSFIALRQFDGDGFGGYGGYGQGRDRDW